MLLALRSLWEETRRAGHTNYSTWADLTLPKPYKKPVDRAAEEELVILAGLEI